MCTCSTQSPDRVLQYCTKYVTKSEPRSQSLKELFRTIFRGLQDGNTFLKAVQKLLINTVGERDYSAQETSYLLLQLPMFKASRDFIILSLDGSCAVEDHLEEGQHTTAFSIVNHYVGRPDSSHFNSMILLECARQYSMPRTLGTQPTPSSRRIVVICRPYVSPDLAGEKYDQYCRQSLMQHKPLLHMDDILFGHPTYINAYAAFLQSDQIPSCLEDDIFHLLQLLHSNDDDSEETEVSTDVFHLCSFFIHVLIIGAKRNPDHYPSIASYRGVDVDLPPECRYAAQHGHTGGY